MDLQAVQDSVEDSGAKEGMIAETVGMRLDAGIVDAMFRIGRPRATGKGYCCMCWPRSGSQEVATGRQTADIARREANRGRGLQYQQLTRHSIRRSANLDKHSDLGRTEVASRRAVPLKAERDRSSDSVHRSHRRENVVHRMRVLLMAVRHRASCEGRTGRE